MFYWCTWKINPSEHGDGGSGGGYPLPSNSTTEVLYFLSSTIYYIGCCLKALEHNFLGHCYMYIFAMKNYFWKSQLNFLNHIFQRKDINRYYILLEEVGIWEKLSKKLPPLNKRILSKKSQENKDEINGNLHKANQAWNYWKFQIHRYILEWVNPRRRDERKNPFCVSS